MVTISPYTPVGRLAERVVGRTPQELRMLGQHCKDHPDEWFVYSVHLNMGAAHNRASRLRGPEFPASLMDFHEGLTFKAYRHEEIGPAVLVRWRVTEGTAQVSP